MKSMLFTSHDFTIEVDESMQYLHVTVPLDEKLTEAEAKDLHKAGGMLTMLAMIPS